jgi:class 3 adenylate cyclase
MMALPEGTVTLLLTEVAGSTALWDANPTETARAVALLDAVVVDVLERHQGVLVKPRGEGDSHFTVFTDAGAAVAAAVDLGRQVANATWPVALGVKMAIHVGPVEVRDGDYYGPPVNRCARMRGVAHGGQIVLSRAAADAVGDRLPDRTSLVSLGSHFLKDLARPVEVLQLLHPALPAEFPPLSSLAAPGTKLPLPLTSLVGRDDWLAQHGDTTRRPGLYALTGPAGVGKSRLGLELAALWLDEHSGESVEVAHLHDDAITIDADGLLLLDDVDRALDEARRAVADSGPGRYVVVTCRRPPGFDNETVIDVPTLATADAVRLLRDRASAAAPDVEIDDDIAGALVEVLDNRPLAIELAAARLPVLPPPALLELIKGDPLRVLGGRRHGPAHHRSWRDALAWAKEG